MPRFVEVEHKLNQAQLEKIENVVKKNWKPLVASIMFAAVVLSVTRQSSQPSIVIHNLVVNFPISEPGPVLL